MKNLWLAVLLTLAPAAEAGAEILHLVFADPVGDPTGEIDVFAAWMTFDDTTGEYSLTITATNEQPFAGEFRININLFNPDVGSTDCAVARFGDTLNDFDLDLPSREVTLSGFATVLTGWAAGDRVATNSAPFGDPDCSGGFSSAVTALPHEHPFPGDDIAGGDTFAVILADLVFFDGFESGSLFAWSSSMP